MLNLKSNKPKKSLKKHKNKSWETGRDGKMKSRKLLYNKAQRNSKYSFKA
jgi:hypothetical protein